MALSGSQKAYLQARSGLARSGATRSNYYLFRAVVTIDVGGVPTDVSAYVAYNGWSISLNLNDEVDTATVSLLPTLPFVPQTRTPIRIGFGAAGNVQFSGLILTVQRTRRAGPDPRSWYDLTCIDWLTVFDAHLVVADYPTQSATTTILDLVTRFTRGHFSTAGVPAGLPSVANMSIVNERPSTVIRRLTNKIGGGFYLDAQRRLRAWSATIPSPIQESVPVPLTDHLATLKTFSMTEDASQQRTRLFVEGQRTATHLAVPAFPGKTADFSDSIPVEDGHTVMQGDANAPSRLTRIGTQIGQAFFVRRTLAPADNPEGTILTADADVGATLLTVEDTSAFATTGGWAQVAGQIVGCAAVAPTTLQISAAGAYGALEAPVTAGTQIIVLPWVQFAPLDRTAADPLFSPIHMRAQPDASPVVLAVMKENAPVAAAIAAREMSDGFYEHLVQDGRYNEAGATARAEAELADFSEPLVSYAWDTEDLNAEPGRLQHIAFTEGTPITVDVRITNVEIRPVTAAHPPRRTVRAARVMTAGVVDVWIDEER